MYKQNKNKYIKLFSLTPHSKQKIIFESSKRFKVIVAGRRFGKSYYSAFYEIIPMLLQKNKTIWIIAPTYELASRIFSEVVSFILLFPSFVKSFSKSDMELVSFSNSFLVAKSCVNPESLLGAAIDLIITDESAFINDNIFYSYIRPLISDKVGRGVFIGTPRAKNWFYKFYKDGLNSNNKEIDSFNFSSFDNPYVSTIDLRDVYDTIPNYLFKEEYLATFTENALFFNVNLYSFSSKLRSADKNEKVVIGLDIARKNDYTVLTAISLVTRELIGFERFNNLTWNESVLKIKNFVSQYKNYKCYADATGVGDAVLEMLTQEGVYTESIIFNHRVKENMLFNLALMLCEKNIILTEDKEIKKELKNFSIKNSKNGKTTYGKNSVHDDIVISLSLAAWGIRITDKDSLKSFIV